MPVDHRTMQPFGVLHGGVSVALAETIGSLRVRFVWKKAKLWWDWILTPIIFALFVQVK